MSSALPPIERIAELLGGDVRAGEVLCPGPGHSVEDRSLSVKLDRDDPESFFAGDDWKECRDHVRAKLELPEPEPHREGTSDCQMFILSLVVLVTGCALGEMFGASGAIAGAAIAGLIDVEPGVWPDKPQ